MGGGGCSTPTYGSTCLQLVFNLALKLHEVPYASGALSCSPRSPPSGMTDLSYLEDLTGLFLDPWSLMQSTQDCTSSLSTLTRDVCSTILLTQLNAAASICPWIISLLTDRKQQRTQSTGDPQGCVLSPLIFPLHKRRNLRRLVCETPEDFG